MKGHEPLIRVLTLAYSVIVGLILFLVVNNGRVLDDTLSRVLVGVLVSTILGVLVFLFVWKGPAPVPAPVKGGSSQKQQKQEEKKKKKK